MRILVALTVLVTITTLARAVEVHWDKQSLTADFVSEGASAADFDGDGDVDLLSGSYLWLGPEFTERFAYRDPVTFNPQGYSDHFFSFAVDADRDGNPDLIRVGFPGKQATLHLNPGPTAIRSNQVWSAHVIADQVSNESPTLVDLIDGGLPELVCSRDGTFGYYQAGDDPTASWEWHAVSPSGVTATPFGHGLGVGDVDGDGRLDVIDPTRWWQQPSGDPTAQPWTQHQWALQPYGAGGAQILVHDVDGDGLNDLITSLNAHGYGLAWFAQRRNENGERRFIRNDILGDKLIDNPFGVVFSQLHALALADVDGDGFEDIVTGKRYWAHGGKDIGGGQAAVLYWFSGARDADGQVRFQPQLVDDHSGVGTDVLVTDLSGDGAVEIVSSNKHGVAIHFQHRHADDADSSMMVWNEGAENEAGFAAGRTPADATAAMQVPSGFKVDLIASEPELAQPIAMCFDAAGRIWIAEGHSYPTRAPEGKGADRILILEDTDRDGSFETKKVFAEGLNLVSGIELGFGGVWVGAAPYLLFIPDTNSDDVPDGPPQVLLDGWGYQDTHETLNSFTWGPDGWLYGCHGVFTHSRVGKPGTADADRIPLNAAIWRYHPTRHQFEVFCWGGSNAWGIDFNDRGDWFMECCVIPHLFHVMQGARYHRQAGQHFNPHIYEDLPTIADHLHYGDGTFSSAQPGGGVNRDLVRRTAASTSMLGGGHAHCGMAIYLGDSYPDTYYGDLFFHNLHGHRIVRESVVTDGSGYVGHHRPDLVRTLDHSFVGVGVMLGPDGSLFFSDWHDPQTCHNRDPEIWDRSNGRVYRLRYGDVRSTAMDLPAASDQTLIEMLIHRNAMIARQAVHLLHQRAARGSLDRQVARRQFEELHQQHSDTTSRLRMLWARHCCGLLDARELIELMKDPDQYVRGWAIQFFAEQPDSRSSQDWAALAAATEGESSLVTLRYLASALQRIPLASRWTIASQITRHPLWNHDKNLPLLVWYAIEPLVGEEPAMAITRFGSDAGLRQKIVRRSAGHETGRNAIVAQLATSESYDTLATGLAELSRWLPESNQRQMPAGWESLVGLAETLIKQRGKDEKQLRGSLRQLGMRMGDPTAFPYYRQRALDRKLEPAQRAEAIEALRQAGDDQVGRIAAEVLGESALQPVAVAAIVAAADAAVAPKVVRHLATLPVDLRNDLINFLATRPATASELLAAIEAGTIDRSIVSAVLLRQMQALDDANLQARIESVWGRVNREPGDFQKQKDHWLEILTENRIGSADVGHGRFVYDQVCGNCHRLFGNGKEIGPDLTGSNRKDINYLLENVLAPNAIIGNAYQMHAFLMDDGRLITGLVREENDNIIRVVMSAGTEVTLQAKEVESRKLSDQSMMPMELLDKMHPADVIDLVAYLRSDKQVAPREQHSVPPGQVDPLNVVEAEWLSGAAKASTGRVQSQNMRSFPDKWSGDTQLWWTGGQRGATLTLHAPSPHSGPCDVAVHLTTAVDYPIVRVRVNDLDWQTADLFTPQVHLLPQPLRWTGVPLENGQPLRLEFEMMDGNPQAQNRWMLGIDRIEIVPSKSDAVN